VPAEKLPTSRPYSAARAAIEWRHKVITQLSGEKLQLAAKALEMIQHNIGKLDLELGPFMDEMKAGRQAGGGRPPHSVIHHIVYRCSPHHPPHSVPMLATSSTT